MKVKFTKFLTLALVMIFAVYSLNMGVFPYYIACMQTFNDSDTIV